MSYGAGDSGGLFVLNWLVAIAGVGIHLHGSPSRVFWHYAASVVDATQRKNRLKLSAERAVQDGVDTLGDLEEQEFPIASSVVLRLGEVDGHRLVQEGDAYILYSKGLLDDADRTAFIHRQRTSAAQVELAKELVRVQLEMLGYSDVHGGFLQIDKNIIVN